MWVLYLSVCVCVCDCMSLLRVFWVCMKGQSNSVCVVTRSSLRKHLEEAVAEAARTTDAV